MTTLFAKNSFRNFLLEQSLNYTYKEDNEILFKLKNI